MNQRPSTGILTMPRTVTAERSARSLRRRLIFMIGLAAVIVVGGLASSGLYVLKRSMGGDEDARIANAASLSKQLVERVLAERSRQVELIASSPSVLEAANKGAAEAVKQGLPAQMGNAMPAAVLDGIEAKYKATRSLQVDPAAKQYLTGLLPKLDIAEVMVTDRYGYNARHHVPVVGLRAERRGVVANRVDERITTAIATADPATKKTVVELSGVIRDGTTKTGVVKVKFGLSVVDSVLAQGAGGTGTAGRSRWTRRAR